MIHVDDNGPGISPEDRARALKPFVRLESSRSTRGGTSFWLTGPPGFDATALSERLRGRGVLIDIGEKFCLSKDRRSFRLGFAFVPVKKLEEGIRLIAEEVNVQLADTDARSNDRTDPVTGANNVG